MGSRADNDGDAGRLRPPGADHREAAGRLPRSLTGPATGPTGGEVTKVAVLLAAVLAVTVMAVAIAAAPSLAQTSGDFPDYVLEEDGTVRIDGDATTDCRSFALFLEQGYFESGDPSAGAQRVLEQCEEAGLLPSGGTTSGTSPGASAQGGEFAPNYESKAPRDEGSSYRGAYEVTEDGALIFGGDVRYSCGSLVAMGAPANPGSEDATIDGSVVEPLTWEAVHLCAEAGFPPVGVTSGTPASSSASGSSEASAANEEDRGLPDTGGPDLPALLLAAAAGLASAGLLFRWTRSRDAG